MTPVTLAELDSRSRALALQQIEETECGTTALAVLNPKSSAYLLKLESAHRALAESRTLSEVKQIRDIAEAARVYAKAANLGHEAQNYAAEIALLAARKAGEILTELDRTPAGRPKISAKPAPISPYQKTLEETQTPIRTAQRWQEIAAISPETFTKYIASVKPTDEISAAGLLKAVKSPHVPTPNEKRAIHTAQELQDACRQVGLNVEIVASKEPQKFHLTYRNVSFIEIIDAIKAAETRLV